MARDLALVALGVATCDADHKVKEEGGNNKGPRIFQYLRNVDPPINIAAAWCAAALQYWFDVAARTLGVKNPLDGVRLEAYVQSYHDFLMPQHAVEPNAVLPGDIVMFHFGEERWDHIGIVAVPPNDQGVFFSVEGNTNEAGSREGDGVLLKPRNVGPKVCFARVE